MNLFKNKFFIFKIKYLFILLLLLCDFIQIRNVEFTTEDILIQRYFYILKYRNKVKEMFDHGFNAYMNVFLI